MTVEEYERTHEQNEDLGLNDMVLEGYNPEAEGTAPAPAEAETKA
jgi:zinc finger protein